MITQRQEKELMAGAKVNVNIINLVLGVYICTTCGTIDDFLLCGA